MCVFDSSPGGLDGGIAVTRADIAERTEIIIGISRLSHEEWKTLRTLRLHALRDSSNAFLGNIADEIDKDAQYWKIKCLNEIWYVARVNGGSVGIAKLHDSGSPSEATYIESMWVKKRFRRIGVAKSLVQALEKETVARCKDEIRLWVFENNIAARKLYESLGYHGPVNEQSLCTARGDVIEQEFRKTLGPAR